MKNNGFTLPEIIIYTCLISFLIAGFVQSIYFLNERDAKLIYEIQDFQNQ